MEDIEGLHLLAGADELDRLVDHGLDREGSTAAGITVHLCEHHSVEVETVVEGLGGLHGILTCHGIDHEEGLGRLDGLLDGSYLVHHLLVHSKTAGGIDDNQRVIFLCSVCYGILSYLNRVLNPILCIDEYFCLASENFQLVNSRRPVHVSCHQHNFQAALALAAESQLAAEGRLTGTGRCRAYLLY